MSASSHPKQKVRLPGAAGAFSSWQLYEFMKSMLLSVIPGPGTWLLYQQEVPAENRNVCRSGGVRPPGGAAWLGSLPASPRGRLRSPGFEAQATQLWTGKPDFEGLPPGRLEMATGALHVTWAHYRLLLVL